MTLEIEKKYLDVNFDTLHKKLMAAGAKTDGVHFECNIIFDYPEYILYKQKKIVRLRSNEWPDKIEYVMTYKSPAPVNMTGIKVRNEIECLIDDIQAMQKILLGIGLMEIARYEKIRHSFNYMEAKIELDRLPFGNIVEIEAKPEAFPAIEKTFNLDKCQISSKSYHELHQQWRSQNDLKPDANFVFPEEIRSKERRLIGLS